MSAEDCAESVFLYVLADEDKGTKSPKSSEQAKLVAYFTTARTFKM